jgi:hypothetical protein
MLVGILQYTKRFLNFVEKEIFPRISEFSKYIGVEDTNMSSNRRLVRDGKNKLIASVQSGFGDSELVKDVRGKILGRTNEHFHQTRDANNKLVSTSTADAGLLIRKK